MSKPFTIDAPVGSTTMALEDDTEIVIARTFRAAPSVVFDAWTKPELVARWWAPKSLGVAMVSCEADVRVGGTYRYVIKPPEQDPVGFSGTYLEITPPTKLVYTHVFEPMAHAGGSVVTVLFSPEGAHTRMVSYERYPSKEVRDMVLASGMEHGMRDIMDQLDALVAAS